MGGEDRNYNVRKTSTLFLASFAILTFELWGIIMVEIGDVRRGRVHITPIPQIYFPRAPCMSDNTIPPAWPITENSPDYGLYEYDPITH